MYEDFEKCQSDTWKIKYRNAGVAHLIGKLCKMYPKKIAFSISYRRPGYHPHHNRSPLSHRDIYIKYRTNVSENL